MLDTDTFSHTGSGGTSPGDRMKAAGFTFTAPWTWGENIAYRSGTTNSALMDRLEEDLFVDSGITGRGHRTNLMNTGFREMGAGVVSGSFKGYSVGMLTEDFAKSGTSLFLTGVAFKDTVTKDNFYTPGEGLAGVTISAKRLSDGATFTTTSWTSGGYSLALSSGTYAVTATGGGLASPISYGSVNIGAENVKRDFIPSAVVTTPRDITPPTAVLTRAKPLRTGGGRYYNFVVTYTDDTANDPATLDNGDLIIYGAGGYARLAVFYNLDPSSTAKVKIANYMVKGPGAIWDPTDNGVYTLKLQANQIADTAGNKAAAATLGSILIRIPLPTAIPATARPTVATPFATTAWKPEESALFA